jgi:hypothetical protein
LGALLLAGLFSGCGGGHNASAAGAPPAPSPQERREEAAIKAAREHRDVVALEKAVLGDAQILAKGGVVRGPILSVHCTQMTGVSSSSLSTSEGAFDCLVANRDQHVAHHGRIVEGIHFYGRIDFLHSGVFTFGGDPQGPPFRAGS